MSQMEKSSFRVYDWHRQDTRMTELKDVCVTAAAGWGGGGNNMPYVLEESMDAVVRRLTPMECERLQGYPDGWTDIGDWVDSKGKKHKGDSDSPRYKALGNSIALPFWEWMAERMVKQLDTEHPTMASLFDGIGGFPLVYSRCGCTPVWASEIEEFPIAVTKERFKDDN
jgi:DNA (cytosine-5)-methyltransferase 1